MTNKQAYTILGSVIGVSLIIFFILLIMVFIKYPPSKSNNEVSKEYIQENNTNILLSYNIKEGPVHSGSGDVIGTYGYVEIPMHILKDSSEEEYAEFCKLNIDGNQDKYNYFIIYTTKDKGIIYYGSMSYFGEYGDIDDNQSISNITASIKYNSSTKKYECIKK